MGPLEVLACEFYNFFQNGYFIVHLRLAVGHEIGHDVSACIFSTTISKLDGHESKV